jgi:hypothetical protein
MILSDTTTQAQFIQVEGTGYFDGLDENWIGTVADYVFGSNVSPCKTRRAKQPKRHKLGLDGFSDSGCGYRPVYYVAGENGLIAPGQIWLV